MLPETPQLATEQPSARKAVKKISTQGLYLPVGGWLLLIGLYIYEYATSLTYHWGNIESLSSMTMNIFLVIPMYSFWGLISLRRLIGLRSLNRKRRNIALASSARLATVQPQPDHTPLSNPLAIEQRVNWAYVFKNACYVSIIVFAIFTLYLAVEYLLWKSIYTDIFTWSIVPLILLIWIIGGALSARSSSREQVIALENGLLKKMSGKEEFMPWHEVRLFAIDTMDISNKNTSILTFSKRREPTFFELSSQSAILQWQWLHPPRWYELTIAQPVIGYDTYDQQMQTLLSIIAARTGQPLYDLR